MAGSTISTTITMTVYLYPGHRQSPLTITSTGTIAPVGTAAYGIYGAGLPGQPLTISNAGVIGGGTGHSGGVTGGIGGYGVELLGAGDIDNTGTISGGTGGMGVPPAGGNPAVATAGGAGGIAVEIVKASDITNFGTLAGGTGGYLTGQSGTGGAGGAALIADAGGVLDNGGTIEGGQGTSPGEFGSGNSFGTGGGGGAGAVFGGRETVTNTGRIIGGSVGVGVPEPSGNGGMGLDFRAGGVLENTGTVSGGPGGTNFANEAGVGGVAVQAEAFLTISNAGSIVAGANGTADQGAIVQAAATAIVLSAGGQIDNTGTILGGYGNIARYAEVSGGVGMDASGTVTVRNSGLIAGGASPEIADGMDAQPGGRGGTGLLISGVGHVSNHGTILGGQAGGGNLNQGGDGGTGLEVSGSATVTNAGLICGGAGAQSPTTDTNPDETGGPGLVLDDGNFLPDLVTNTGIIRGGIGGAPNGEETAAGQGGTGAVLSSFYGVTLNRGLIVGGAATSSTYGSLAVQGGAGVILSTGELINAGTISGGLDNDGSVADAVQFTGQATLVIDPGAVFDGLVQAVPGAYDTLELAGHLAGSLAGIGTAFTGFDLFDVQAGAHWTLSGANTLGGVGQLTVDGSLKDAGSLSVAGTISGAGTLAIASGATLSVAGDVGVANLVFARNGALEAATGTITSTIGGFGTGDTIDLSTVAASALQYGHGKLTLLHDGAAMDRISIAGTYTAADFTLTTDASGGSLIGFAPPTAASSPEPRHIVLEGGPTAEWGAESRLTHIALWHAHPG